MSPARVLLGGVLAGVVWLGALPAAPAAPAPTVPAPATSAPAVPAPATSAPADPDGSRADDRLARIVSVRPTAGGGVRVVSDVTLPAADAPRLGGGAGAGEEARVRLVTADGAALRRTAITAGQIRAELPRTAGGTELTGQQVEDPAPVLRVRVPVHADLRTVGVRIAGREHTAAYRVPARRSVAPTRLELPGWELGPSSNRLDMVVLGDGYTAEQQGDFVADAAAVLDDLFAITPYAEHRDLVNAVGVFAPSAQSGADQPAHTAGCEDRSPAPTCCPEPSTGNPASTVDTRYDSTFCSYGIQRLLVPLDTGAVVSDADAAHPGWEQVLLVVNDEEYGGSGGFLATTSTNPAGTQVMAHELGHSLLGLDDEYDTLTPGYPPCSDVPRSTDGPCLPNVTDVSKRARLKWRRWVAASTPIPTTGPQEADVVGLFEGAHYSPTRWYRSCHDCLMRSLGRPMGAVAGEQLALRLFGDVFGVSLIEPGTVTPETAETVVAAPGEAVRLGLEVLSTRPAPGTRVTWTIDGDEVSSEVVGSGASALDVIGTDTAQRVRVTVESLPGVLHPQDVGLTRETRSWTVAPTSDVPPLGGATGPATGPARRYARLPAQLDCQDGSVGVRLTAPRRAPSVRTVVLAVDGTRVARVRRSQVPGTVRLPLDVGAHQVSAVVKRAGARTVGVVRSYTAC